MHCIKDEIQTYNYSLEMFAVQSLSHTEQTDHAISEWQFYVK